MPRAPDRRMVGPERGRWNARALILLATVAGIVAFDFWLISDQDICASFSPHDDYWFIQKAEDAYWFDQGYSQFSFIKEPTYPLFVAATYRLRIPLRWAHEGLYLLAGGFLAWALVYRQSSALVGVAIFTVSVLNPLRFYVFRQALHDSIYTSLLLLGLGAVLLQFKMRGREGWPWRWLASGLALGLLWNTRGEGPIVVLLLLPFLVADAIDNWRGHRSHVLAFRHSCIEWAPPLLMVAAITLLFMFANNQRWGVFALTDWSAPKFKAAYRMLLSIRPESPAHYVPVAAEVRRRAYGVSPAFSELTPHLESKELAHWSRIGREFRILPPGQEFAGGEFFIALRDAAVAAGYGRSARQMEAYFARVERELAAAAADGRLPTRWIPPGLGWTVVPDIQIWLPQLAPSWARVWWGCWRSRLDHAVMTDSTDPKVVARYDRVARRRHVPTTSPTFQGKVRAWIWDGYTRGMEAAVVISYLVAGCVILRPSTRPGWRAYMLPALALGIYSFGRLALLTVFDASSFVTVDTRYLMPSAVLLSVSAAWLLAEGFRMSVFPRRALSSGTRPRPTTKLTTTKGRLSPPAPRLAPITWGITCLAIGLLLSFQWVYSRLHLPDTLPQIGVMGIDNGKVNGWARIHGQLNTPVEVEIYDGETLLGAVLADLPSEGLAERGIGDGRHGYSFMLPRSLWDGKPHTIRAMPRGTYSELTGSRQTITLYPDHLVQGSLDTVNASFISGWALDKADLNRAVTVNLYDGDRHMATVVADQLRQDFLDSGVGTGRYAFSIDTPKELMDGQSHWVRARIAGASRDLPGSPVEFKAANP